MKPSTIFFSSLLAAAAMSTVPAFADYTWKGGDTITQDLWQTESSWTHTGSSWSSSGSGPGTTNSAMWDKIVISGESGNQISGSINSLEGWALNLNLKNTLLTVGNLVKFQGGTSITLDDTSVLTVNGFSVGKAEGDITLSGAGTIVGKMFFSQGGYHSASVNLESWTGTIKSVDLDLSEKDALNLSHHGNAKSTVELSGFSGYFSEQNDGTVSTNIKLTNSSTSDRNYAVNITNGWSDKGITFTGKVSGDGTFKNTGPSGGGNSVSQGFLFTGDVSEFSGKFEQSGNRAAAVLKFGNGGAGVTGNDKSVSGTGEIAWGNYNVVYNYSNDVIASNTITSAKLVKQGDGSLTLTGTNTFSGGTTIEEGALIAGGASALGTGKVTVAENAKLGFLAGTTVSGVTGGVEFANGAKLVIDMQSKASEADTFTLKLISETVLKYNNTDVSSSNVSSLLGGAVELKNWDKTGWTQSLAYEDSSKTLSLTMTNVPEPSMFGLLAGVGALALVAARRRRRAK